jgi:hypothetical protein
VSTIARRRGEQDVGERHRRQADHHHRAENNQIGCGDLRAVLPGEGSQQRLLQREGCGQDCHCG